jgi:hypothetical protein
LATSEPGLWQPLGFLCARAEQRDRPGAEALHREGKVRQARVTRECFADQRERTDIDIVRRIFTRRSVFEPAITAQLAHQFSAGGIDIVMVDICAMLRGPGFQLVGKRPMALLEKRPTQETTVEHRQFPANCGFCLATKAS